MIFTTIQGYQLFIFIFHTLEYDFRRKQMIIKENSKYDNYNIFH